MNDKLKIAIIQQEIINGNKEENILTVASKMNQIEKDSDIVVLPELFSTGFISDSEKMKTFAEPNTGITMDTMYRYAQYYNMAICGSFIAKTGEQYYNRAFFIEPSGEEAYYDKRHLFSLSEEAKVFTEGDKKSPIIR